MKNVLITCAGMACGCAALAAPPALQAGRPVKIDPISVAAVRRVDGKLVRTSDWIPYSGNSRETGVLAFDSFQPGEAHEPIGGTECDLQGGGYRWWFGSDYYAPFVAEDMMFDSLHSGATINEYSLSWAYQVPGGTPLDTSFAIAFFTYNEMIDNVDCASSSVGVFPTDFTPASDGVIANYGQLPQGNWYSNIDALNDFGVLLPDGGDGTYEQLQLWVDDISGDLFICPGPCGPFLWGTSEDGGLPGRPGSQDIQAYLDDGGGVGNPDGAYDPGIECYDMTSGVCPDPLANMGAFWVKPNGGEECFPTYENCRPPRDHGWYWYHQWWLRHCECWLEFAFGDCFIDTESGKLPSYAAADSTGYELEPTLQLPFLDLTRSLDGNVFVAFDVTGAPPPLVRFFLYDDAHGYTAGSPIFLGEQAFDGDARYTVTFDRGTAGLDGTVVAQRVERGGVSTVGVSLVRNVCAADTDMNGFVNGIDYDLFVIGFETGGIDADVDGNGFVNGIDFDLFVQSYESGC